MDDYERIRELGRGSFGAAILVRRRSDGKQLVAKANGQNPRPMLKRVFITYVVLEISL